MDYQNDNPVDPIDISLFKEHTCQSLLKILDSLPNEEKTLIIEKSCISKLNYITSLDPLIERKVRKDLVLLESKKFIAPTPILIYMLPPSIESLKIIDSHISENKKKEFHLIFVPKIGHECTNFIDNSKNKSFYNIHNLNIDMFSLDYDLISLEDHNAFYNIYVKEKYDCLSELKRIIIKYETVFGKIKYKYSKGPLAQKLNQILSNEKKSFDNNNENETLACFIFDRSVDMVTPLCSNFTYEGLIDENFDINFNSIKVSPKLLEKDLKQEYIKIDLSRNDKFYSMIKDYNFIKIRTFLPNRLKEHSAILEEGKQKTDDMRKVQQNLIKVRQVQEERVSLANHINIADYISKKQKSPLFKFYLNFEQSMLIGDLPEKLHDFIDDEIGKKADEYNILRIICLESIIHGGIRYRIYDEIKKDFLNVYGYKEIFLWHNLEKMDILKSQDNNYFYSAANTDLNLIYEDIDVNNPNDSSYAYGGYCPIIIRLIEKAYTNGWGSIQETLKKIPGEADFPVDETEMVRENNEKKYFLVVFIGGITYGELGAIRYLNKINKNKKIVVLTTSMINTKKIFNALSLKGEIKNNK